MKSISRIKVGNEVFDVKDITARQHLVEVQNDQPTSEDNKIWIRETAEEVQVPTYQEFSELVAAYQALKARVDRLDPQS